MPDAKDADLCSNGAIIISNPLRPYQLFQRDIDIPQVSTINMKRNIQSIYRDNVDDWWDSSKYYLRMLANQSRPRIKYFNRVAPNWQNQVTLDLGCGGGYMSEKLVKMGAKVIGIDPVAELLETACRHAAASGLEIKYLTGSGEAIPLDDCSVDRVVCVDVFEHVGDLPKVIAEIARVLKPGGILLFDTVNKTVLARLGAITLMENILCIIPRGVHDPEKFIKPTELSDLLKANQLDMPLKEIEGMMPVWIDRHLDLVFGLLPFTQIVYLGYATKK
jgi:2-polyprenyl-6-hydroxyphenyl methylase/3-demethylubiquinone-9 3-methyltransferase